MRLFLLGDESSDDMLWQNKLRVVRLSADYPETVVGSIEDLKMTMVNGQPEDVSKCGAVRFNTLN